MREKHGKGAGFCPSSEVMALESQFSPCALDGMAFACVM